MLEDTILWDSYSLLKLNHMWKVKNNYENFSLEIEILREFEESCLSTFKFTRDTLKPVTTQQNESCAFLTQK